jgi:hypothetical protein
LSSFLAAIKTAALYLFSSIHMEKEAEVRKRRVVVLEPIHVGLSKDNAADIDQLTPEQDADFREYAENTVDSLTEWLNNLAARSQGKLTVGAARKSLDFVEYDVRCTPGAAVESSSSSSFRSDFLHALDVLPQNYTLSSDLEHGKELLRIYYTKKGRLLKRGCGCAGRLVQLMFWLATPLCLFLLFQVGVHTYASFQPSSWLTRSVFTHIDVVQPLWSVARGAARDFFWMVFRI